MCIRRYGRVHYNWHQGFGSASISCGSGFRSSVQIFADPDQNPGFEIFADPDPGLDFTQKLFFYVKKEK